MSTLETLFSNIAHAAYNGESVTIGGGVFSPSELRIAGHQFRQVTSALHAGWEAFDDEEDSVKEEHEDVIEQMSKACDLVHPK